MSKSFLGKGLLTSAAALAVLFGFSTQTSAQEPWQNNFPVGKIVESIEGDLDGDDIPETISLKVFKVDERGVFTKLVITDSQGRVLATSPELCDFKDPRTMGNFDWGCSELAATGAIASPYVGIYVATPRSDVRPPVYAIWRYDAASSTLKYQRKKCLLETKDGTYEWRDSPGNYGYGIRWLDKLKNPQKQAQPQYVTATVCHYFKNNNGNGSFESDQAELKNGTSSLKNH